MRLAAVVWFLASLASVCEARTLDAVASFTVLADVVKIVGGEHVAVASLVPAGGDPHRFEPSPDHAKALARADLVFLSSPTFETWMPRLAKAAAYKRPLTAVSAGIETLDLVEDGRRTSDPHVWNDPSNVARWTTVIADALSSADPEHKAAFVANAERYRAQLDEADVEARKRIAAIASEKRKVLTSHESLGYFGKAYGVRIFAPVGYSTEKEPSAATVARIITQIRKEGVRIYFFENAGDKRLVTQVAKATGAAPGGELFVESLSAPDGPAGSYLAMFRRNVDLLTAAMMR